MNAEAMQKLAALRSELAQREHARQEALGRGAITGRATTPGNDAWRSCKRPCGKHSSRPHR
jgi:hypothetical protein